jgi:type IV pilus assembly protein PilQ
MIIGALIGSLVSCASQQAEDEDSLTTQSYQGGGGEATSGKDDFSDFDNAGGTDTAQSQAPNQDSDLALENEINQSNNASPEQQFAQNEVDAQAAKEMQPQAPAEEAAPAPAEPAPPTPEIVDNPAPQAPAEPMIEEPTPPAPEPVAETPSAPVSTEKAVEITGLKYKANDAGGTVVIESNAPVTYTTRANPELKQYIIEIPNSVLPKKLKRTLNTKDIKGAVGAVDAYQSPGSHISRIVVQMRDGYGEPTVQQEGNSILVVTSAPEAGATPEKVAAGGSEGEASYEDLGEETHATGGDVPMNADLNNSKILASQSLQEYLSGNTKFYGRKISIETSNIDVRDALKFITEESGVNMVITDEVKGNVSLKLRQVPWDQALVMIMKARKLGYSRQGNVLRIVPLDELKKEEEDATKLAQARKNVEPLKVRAFSISYAKIDDLDKKVKDFLSERGKVVGDARTSTLVVTDIEDSLNRVAKLIQGLDSAPPQVLIEGKIVEASEDFQRSIGINWGFSGADKQIGTGPQGPINMHPSLNVGATTQNAGGLGFGLNVGTLDIFGNLTASLALFEREDKIKVLSAPRIMTLSNEKADISQTNELPVKTLTPQTTGQPQITYQFKPLTLKLEVTPQITTQGTIIMKVSVNRQIKGPAVSATDDTFSVNSREANTRVIVKNGQTAVIGGIYRTDLTEGVTGVPWLKDIPVLGYLFKGTTTDRQRSELLIFLTPRILAQADSGGGMASESNSGGEL